MISMFNVEEKARLWDNMFRRVNGVEPLLTTSIEKMFWAVFTQAQERNEAQYEKTCLKNRENGKKGGAPIGNTNAMGDNNPLKRQNGEKQPIASVNDSSTSELQEKQPKQPKQPDKDKDKDRDRDKERDNDKDIDMEFGKGSENTGDYRGPEEYFEFVPAVSSHPVDECPVEPVKPESSLDEETFILFKEALNDLFVEEQPSWEKSLAYLGADQFIKNNYKEIGTFPEIIAMIREFYELRLKFKRL